MNSVASGLIEAIKYAFGADPYTYPPGTTGTDWDIVPTGGTSWYKYGGGGINSWGSVCGVPNASIAVLNLMNLNTATNCDQIMYYVCQTEFPPKGLHDLYLDSTYGWVGQESTFAPEPMPDDDVLAYTISNSPLCHASIGKWSYAAGVNLAAAGTTAGTAHKTDRCAKVCAGVAAFAAGLINGAISSLTTPVATAECLTCHNTSSTSVVPGQQGKMDCLECHTDFRPHFNPRVVVENVWTADGSGIPKTDFHGGDQIQLKVRFSVMGPGQDDWSVKTTDDGRSGVLAPCGKKLLTKSEKLGTGLHEWTWSNTVPSSCSGEGKFNMKLELKNEYNVTLSVSERICVFHII